MKLNANSQLGLAIDDNMIKTIMEHHLENFINKSSDEKFKAKAIKLFGIMFLENMMEKIRHIMTPEDQERYAEAERLEREYGGLRNTNYLVAEPALDLAKRIKIDKKFDPRFLSKVSDKKVTFLLGKDRFIRFFKDQSTIFIIVVGKTPKNNGDAILSYSTYRMETDTGDISCHDNPDQPFDDPIFLLFTQLLVFTELSELETVILKPKEKRGTKKDGKVINDSPERVIIVDSTWNKTIVRTEGFGVRGHFRIQPCGTGRLDRELIFIEEFKKNGYIRKAKRQILDEK